MYNVRSREFTNIGEVLRLQSKRQNVFDFESPTTSVESDDSVLYPDGPPIIPKVKSGDVCFTHSVISLNVFKKSKGQVYFQYECDKVSDKTLS